MKIVHIITRLSKGGAEENTLMSCRHQAEAGHDVTLVFGTDNLRRDQYRKFEEKVAFHECPVLRHQIKPLDEIRALIALTKYLRQEKPDIVHTHTSKAGILGRLAAWIAGVPMIVHGVHILPFANVGWKSRFLYLALEHVTALITDLFVHVSKGTMDAYLQEKIGKSKLHYVAHSGMDIESFKTAQPPEDWQKIVGEGWDKKPKIILMMAALEERKQHIPFIEGLAQNIKPEDDICLICAGEGPLHKEIDAKIEELNMSKHVRLLGFYPTPEELVALADISALASLREGLPRVIVQSFAGNCPAVTGPIEGIEEIVFDGKNGAIVLSRNARDVAKETATILKDGMRYKKLKEGAIQTNIDSWSVSSMYKALDESYEHLFKKKGL